jgi:hypothetical protein
MTQGVCQMLHMSMLHVGASTMAEDKPRDGAFDGLMQSVDGAFFWAGDER